MLQAPYLLDRRSRETVLEALREVCVHRGWSLLAAHVRTNHVHAVVVADVRPESVLNDFKSYASGGLNRLGKERPDRKRWARHGSTQWLWKDQDVQEAIRYVVEGQGEPMAVFLSYRSLGARVESAFTVAAQQGSQFARSTFMSAPLQSTEADARLRVRFLIENYLTVVLTKFTVTCDLADIPLVLVTVTSKI